jgi:threonylcarbamoyladenosine tRNA methylthiotransferase MtaB
MYRDLVDRLAGAIPGLGLGADVIVGHPGETDADFEATLALVAALPFSYLHVFAYSDRKGTEAARRPGHVPAAVIRERSRRLRHLGHEKSRTFRHALVGTRREVLVLETRDHRTGLRSGLTSNYVEVLFPAPDARVRRLATIDITEIRGGRTHGRLAEAQR